MTELSMLVLLLALFVFKALVPAWKTLRSDFPNYYIVARLLHQHYVMDRIYDWVWLQRVKDHWSIPQPLVGFVGLTPFSALPILPLAWLDALEAKRVWLILNLVVMATSLFGLWQLTALRIQHIAFIAFLAIIPLRNNFLLGQMHMIVFGLLVLAYWFDTRKMWPACALTLAVAASLKIYPAFFVFFFLRKRQWKPAILLICATIAIFAGGFLIFGMPVMRAFLVEQFPRMLRGEAMDPFSLTTPSASCLFHRLFLMQPQLNSRPFIFSPLLFAILYPLWQLSLLTTTSLALSSEEGDSRRRSLEWAAFTCLLLALSTEPASYHRVTLIFVAVLAAYGMVGFWPKTMMLGCYFIACNIHLSVSLMPAILSLLLDFFPYWGILAMLVCLLAVLGGRLHSRSTSWPLRRVAWMLAGFEIVWSGASAIEFVHAQSLNNTNYLKEIRNGAYAQFSSHQVGNHLLTVAMFCEGYRVEDEDGRRYQTAKDGSEEEQLTIASSPGIPQVWIEAISEGNSRLIELPTISTGRLIEPIATILNGESPALSADGRSLVFLLEVRGAGRAWMVHLDETGRVLDSPVPVTPEDMNVSEVSFAGSSVILFSAVEKGISRLFVTHFGETPRRIYPMGDAMDSPAVNMEEGLTIYRRLDSGYWHIFMNNSLIGGAVRVTTGDCSAYNPAWIGATTLVYDSDCGRGMGLGALAIRSLGIVPEKTGSLKTFAISTNRPHNEARQ
ncbi:MAG: glycosyltransferase 87 family protein [Terracidiphilus sp.]